jgi:gamma-glutamylcyclotransferase (GGCT)/AIG2-like uncharacterized protein YtfP
MAMIFTYGTLKKGYYNHHILKDSTFIGEAKLYNYDMYNLGSFPAIKKGSSIIMGEVYEVSPKTLKELDFLESNGFLYQRTLCEVELVNKLYYKVYVYIYIDEIVLEHKINKEVISY